MTASQVRAGQLGATIDRGRFASPPHDLAAPVLVNDNQTPTDNTPNTPDTPDTAGVSGVAGVAAATTGTGPNTAGIMMYGIKVLAAPDPPGPPPHRITQIRRADNNYPQHASSDRMTVTLPNSRHHSPHEDGAGRGSTTLDVEDLLKAAADKQLAYCVPGVSSPRLAAAALALARHPDVQRRYPVICHQLQHQAEVSRQQWSANHLNPDS